MVGTTSPRTSGRSSNSFSDLLRRWRRRLGGYRLFSGYMLALGVTGLVALILFAVLLIGQDAAANKVNQAAGYYQTINNLARHIDGMYIAASRFLVGYDPIDLATSEATFTGLQVTFAEVLHAADAEGRTDLQTIEDISGQYINTFHGLSKLILGRPSNAAYTTQKTLFDALNKTATQLDQAMDSLLIQSQNQLTNTQQSSQDMLTRLRLIVLTIAVLTVCISILVVTRVAHRMSRDLSRIGQAAQAIAGGNLDIQVTLSRDDEIGVLGAAFNRMAEGLRSSLLTESAASEQNRRQILKLARQERVNAILEERQRIARELHDSVKQQLFSITLAAGAALNLLKHAPDLAKTYLEHVQQASTYAQSEMTTLLEELVPVPLQDQRLEDALSQYLRLLCDTHHVKLLWRVEGTNTLSIAQEHALFRAVQEAAANVVRHSKATQLRISVSFGLQTRVVVEDNGQGFDNTKIPPTSTGLTTMRLRLKRVGGIYELFTAPGTGTRLVITVDLRKKVNYEQF